MATFMSADMIIKKVRKPAHELSHIKGSLKTLEKAMYRIQKVLLLDEIQENILLSLPAESDIAVSIKGNFAWDLGMKEDEDKAMKKKRPSDKVEKEDSALSEDSSEFETEENGPK